MTSTASPNSNVKGMAWMVVSGICFVGVYIGVKFVGTRLPAAESAFIRYAMGLLFLVPTLPMMLREGVDKTSAQFFAARGVIHTIAVLLWFFAMARLSVAEVAAMGYMTPVFVTIGAMIFFGERLALRRAMAIALAVVGVIVILRPGVEVITSGHVAMLASTVFMGSSYLTIKRLTPQNSPAMIVGMLSLTVTIGLFPLAMLDWMQPTMTELMWLAIVAVSATAGHFAMTFAYRYAPLTVTQPMTFLQLVWSVAVGFLLFGEAIDVFVILGGLTIVAAVIYITYREAQLKRQASA
ncbi:MAG: DMT family transporter [Planktomarina sp.]